MYTAFGMTAHMGQRSLLAAAAEAQYYLQQKNYVINTYAYTE